VITPPAGCPSRKIVYDSEAHARHAARTMVSGERRGTHRQKPYRCGLCQNWHLTTTSGKLGRKRLATLAARPTPGFIVFPEPEIRVGHVVDFRVFDEVTARVFCLRCKTMISSAGWAAGQCPGEPKEPA